MDEEERIADIDYWWTDAIAESFDYGNERRVHSAFKHVLLAMPDEDFERFMEQQPVLLCLPKIRGKVFKRMIAVPPGAKELKVTFIYLPSNVDRWSEKTLINTVAHEIAHLVLGHLDLQDTKGNPKSKTEAEADTMSEKWGFRRSYTRPTLRQLKAREPR